MTGKTAAAGVMSAVALLAGCLAVGPQVRANHASEVSAAESVIAGVPVPGGSQLAEGGLFDDGQGVAMAFYTHPGLRGEEVLEFYDRVMPEWGWEPRTAGTGHRLQRSYERQGVPIMIGVDKREAGASFNILVGVRGDWGFMPALRGAP